MDPMNNLALFYSTGHQAHAELGHPERPERLETVRQALAGAGWWEPFPCLEPLVLPKEVMFAVHSSTYLANLERICARGQHYDMDTYTTPASWELAHKAAGGAAAVAAAVWHGDSRRGFALTRPPGHHATPDRAMGFCLMNNIALAAEYLVQEAGAQRLAIIDLDLHHGNGTQDIFYSRNDIFYISTHQYPHYPGTGQLEETGAGSGRGFTANFPLLPFSGDQAFRTVMSELILPLLDRFSPQMILVSYGFDPHWRDPLGNLRLSAKVYGEIVAQLVDWAGRNCDGRLAMVLEGGYDLEAAHACTLSVAGALLAEPARDPLGPSPHKEGIEWQGMVRRAKQLWQL